MATMRQWLSEQIDPTTGLPLAKANSRGRFSQAAKAAIADALIRGMEFDDDEPKAPSVPKEKRVVSAGSTATVSRVKAPERDYDFKAVRQWAESNGLSVSKRGRISAEILTQYDASNPATTKVIAAKPPKPRVRPENVAYGLSKPDPEKPYLSVQSVAFHKCYACNNRVAWCSCDDGPRCPQWLNGGEVASLTKP